MIEATQARVERPELRERLTQSLERGSVMLVADAGFGKTTALEQALEGRDEPAVWLRATASDRDPGRLAARLVQGVRATVPGVADERAERLGAAIDPIDADDVVQGLVDDLERLLVEPLVDSGGRRREAWWVACRRRSWRRCSAPVTRCASPCARDAISGCGSRA